MSGQVPQRRGPWSQAEDEQLLHLIKGDSSLNWVKIASKLSSRTPKQCRERYHQNLKPNLNHEPISAEEGRIIEDLVNRIGKRWAEIARHLHNRSDNAVKNWWNGSMNRRKRMGRRRNSEGNGQYPPRPAPLEVAPTTSYSPYGAPSPASRSRYWTHHYSHSGLPSPSTTSPGGDSLFEGAPSLASDSASWYTASPRSRSGPDSPIELPPLRMTEACSPSSYTTKAYEVQRYEASVSYEARPGYEAWPGYEARPGYEASVSYEARPVYEARSSPQTGASLLKPIALPPIRTAVEPRPQPQLLTAPSSPVAITPPDQLRAPAPGSGIGSGEKDSRMKLNHLLH